MITSIRNRTTIGNAMALGFLLATLLSPAPAGAAVPSGKAFSWGYNSDGQLERVMNLGENRIGMRILRLARSPAVARFPHF